MTVPRQVQEIAADLGAIEPQDFDGVDGLEPLDRLCDEMLASGDVRACAPIVFHTMERLDGADLGVPGPLVHTLESWRGEIGVLAGLRYVFVRGMFRGST